MTDPNVRYAWILGLSNGVMAVIIVDAVYTLTSSGGLYLVPWWLAAPYALIVAWRAATYVGALLRGGGHPWRPALEGFVLMFVSAAAYLVPNIMAAHLAGAPPTGWGWAFWSMFTGYIVFYGVIAGAFGGFVGLLLGWLDTLVVDLFPPRPRQTED